MSHITVGLSEGRSSSKVSNPPGGGHTNIFGPPSPPINQKINKQNVSQVQDCIGGQTNSAVPDIIKDQLVAATVVDAGKEKTKEPDNKTETTMPNRVRVPPGGFSSGAFW